MLALPLTFTVPLVLTALAALPAIWLLLRSFKPLPHLPDRNAHLDSIRRFLEATPDAEIVWISDGVAGVDGQGFIEGLTPMAAGRQITVLKSERAPVLAISGVENAVGNLNVRIVRAEPNGRDSGTIRALDLKNLPLADARFAFEADATEATATFDVPTEIRNAIARIEILGESSAGAVSLLDERGKRRRVGLVFGGTSDQAQPLLSPLYYIERALSPYSEIRMGRGAAAEAAPCPGIPPRPSRPSPARAPSSASTSRRRSASAARSWRSPTATCRPR